MPFKYLPEWARLSPPLSCLPVNDVIASGLSSTYWVTIRDELLTGPHPSCAKMFSMWEWYRERWLLCYTSFLASTLIHRVQICSPTTFLLCPFHSSLLFFFLFIFLLVLTKAVVIINRPSSTKVLLLCRWHYVESQLWSNQLWVGFLPPITAVRPALQLQVVRWVCTDVRALFFYSRWSTCTRWRRERQRREKSHVLFPLVITAGNHL